MLNELDPQVKALLEQFQANAARHPAPATPLSAKEKIIALRQMMGASAARRYPAESVSRTEDFATAGPAMGGCRMMRYGSFNEALSDVLRFSKGMTYKNIMAGLPYGGGQCRAHCRHAARTFRACRRREIAEQYGGGRNGPGTAGSARRTPAQKSAITEAGSKTL
jgi:glutamate dehydrogenase/leucine dehydrogenase